MWSGVDGITCLRWTTGRKRWWGCGGSWDGFFARIRIMGVGLGILGKARERKGLGYWMIRGWLCIRMTRQMTMVELRGWREVRQTFPKRVTLEWKPRFTQ